MNAHILPPRWARKIVKLRHWLVLAIPIGIAAGLGVSALESLCNAVFWKHIAELGVPWRLAAPVLGLFLSGWILARLHLRTVGMLNNVVVMYHHPPYALSPKVDLMEAGACVATVGLGGSLGLGGPSQWLGARLALYLRQFIRRIQPTLGISTRQILLIGAAAGVAAYFRAPLAGTILAMETPFRRDMDGTVLIPASIASMLAHIIHGRLVDLDPLLVFSNKAIRDWRGLLAVIILGIVAGILSRQIQRGVLRLRDWTGRIRWTSRALLGGLVTSLTAFLAWRFFGDTWTLQGGLPVALAVFHGQFQGWPVLALLVLKILAVWAALGTTGVAGVLVVTLSIGTLLGGALHPILPGLSLELACSVAVCAYLAANYNAPLTALALSVEWGGAALLLSAWPAVILSAWIGAGMANTPAKTRHRHIRTPRPKEDFHARH
jgi:H+/Cl- antiporter ClcA